MKYSWQITSQIEQKLKVLDQYSFYIKNAPIDPQLQKQLQRRSLLKSSLFSAKIEGNRLNIQQLDSVLSQPKSREKLEVSNLLAALQYVASSPTDQLSIDLIKKLHHLSMVNLDGNAGHFRLEMTAIFNQAGIAVYMTPDPVDILPQLEELITFVNSSTEHPAVIASIAHYWFEKIHPFIDGNGRTGRLLIQFLLDRKQDNFNGLLNFEEEVEKTRSSYYDLLSDNSKNLTSFIEYMLERYCTAGEKAVENLKHLPSQAQPDHLLLPRRQEILALLSDHEYLSFDQIHRRFMGVNPSTLRNDLKQLTIKNFVEKVGTTRGAVYKKKSYPNT